jgi:hypothetical protein
LYGSSLNPHSGHNISSKLLLLSLPQSKAILRNAPKSIGGTNTDPQPDQRGRGCKWLKSKGERKMACPDCGSDSAEYRIASSVETHGLDCGPFERFEQEYIVCRECGGRFDVGDWESAGTAV